MRTCATYTTRITCASYIHDMNTTGTMCVTYIACTTHITYSTHSTYSACSTYIHTYMITLHYLQYRQCMQCCIHGVHHIQAKLKTYPYIHCIQYICTYRTSSHIHTPIHASVHSICIRHNMAQCTVYRVRYKAVWQSAYKSNMCNTR